MEETIFDPKAPQIDRRRCERIELDGGVIYVKEMTAADTLFCLQHSTRQTTGPVSVSLDLSGMQLWQVVVSCYRGREAEAARVFEITDTMVIQKLRAEEWNKIREAINRVNGLADSEVAALQDFTAAPTAISPETSPSFASSNSTGSPVR